MTLPAWLWGLALLILSNCSNNSRPLPGAPAVSVPVKGELTAAAAKGALDDVKQLLARGADVNEDTGTEGNQVTPLLAAVAHDRLPVAEYLVTKGASALPSYQGYSAHDFVLHLQGDDNSLYRQLIHKRWNGGNQ